MELSEQQIADNRERIISLLTSTGRQGVDEVVKYMDANGFFVVPSSRSRHHNWRGGLAQHALGVYDRLSATGAGLPADSIILTALLHDICKARFHYYDETGNLKTRKAQDLHIPGHGTRSVELLKKCGLHLSEEERKAIRWHMGGWKVDREQIRDFFATKKSDLWRLLYNADRYDASHNCPKA